MVGVAAFLDVVKGAGDASHGFAEADGVEEGELLAAESDLLRGAHGHGGRFEEALGEGVGAVHEIVVGDDLPDEAHFLGAFGVDALAEEEKLHGVLPADALGHADGALDGGDADGDFGKPNWARSLAMTKSQAATRVRAKPRQ